MLPAPARLRLLVAGLLLVPATGTLGQPAPSLQSSLAILDSLRTHGHFAAAVDTSTRLARMYPNRVDVLWRRALMLSDYGRAARHTAPTDTVVARHRRALTIARTALAVDSTSAWAHLTTALTAGRLTLHVGRSKRVRYSKAVKRHTDRAIALDSTLAPAYHLRGRWHREVADLNLLKRTLVRAIYSGFPPASFDHSVHDFKRAISLESKPYNHLELGKTYLEMGRDSSARYQFQKTLRTSGSPFEAEHKKEAQALLNTLR